MPFISNEERYKTIKKINKGNGGRKAVVTITLFLWLAYFVLFIVSSYLFSIDKDKYYFFNWAGDIDVSGKGTGMSVFGICMIIIAMLILALNIISTIIVWSFSSPKDVTKKVNKLASSAISGKRTDKRVYKNVKERYGK